MLLVSIAGCKTGKKPIFHQLANISVWCHLFGLCGVHISTMWSVAVLEAICLEMIIWSPNVEKLCVTWFMNNSLTEPRRWIQGCINCSSLPARLGARGVSSEHVENMENAEKMENMEIFSGSPT